MTAIEAQYSCGSCMIIDTHVHIFSFPSFRDLSKYIRTMEDAIAFRTRYPDLYKCNLTEQPIDCTDDLIADMDKNGVDFALVQARAGYVSNDMVAAAAKRHPTRLAPLARVGHDQEAAGYLDDPAPVRERAPAELDRALGKLGMRGIGEIFVRSLTNHVNPEKIANDLCGILRVAEKYQVPIQFPTAWSQFPGGLFYGDPVWADEVAGRHPGVPVILTKMGRSIDRYFDTVMSVAMRNVNIYLDVVGTCPRHLRFAVDKLGADRILFGTDWSTTWRWLSVPATLHQIRLKVLDDAKLTQTEREQILWKNAARLFKLDALLDQAQSRRARSAS
ncbi:MAG TPA: amidohydrolase family protein [Xanthobacteraceae bacterium]|nr:amidohydrolase family protein [Xanthobacteraceae bacterium]